MLAITLAHCVTSSLVVTLALTATHLPRLAFTLAFATAVAVIPAVTAVEAAPLEALRVNGGVALGLDLHRRPGVSTALDRHAQQLLRRLESSWQEQRKGPCLSVCVIMGELPLQGLRMQCVRSTPLHRRAGMQRTALLRA